jgi:hypothetical protein
MDAIINWPRWSVFLGYYGTQILKDTLPEIREYTNCSSIIPNETCLNINRSFVEIIEKIGILRGENNAITEICSPKMLYCFLLEKENIKHKTQIREPHYDRTDTWKNIDGKGVLPKHLEINFRLIHGISKTGMLWAKYIGHSKNTLCIFCIKFPKEEDHVFWESNHTIN